MAVLTAAARNNLPGAVFALPAQRAYPIEDANHARDALARVAQNGSTEQQAQVRAAVRARYPGIDQQADNRQRVVDAIVGR